MGSAMFVGVPGQSCLSGDCAATLRLPEMFACETSTGACGPPFYATASRSNFGPLGFSFPKQRSSLINDGMF